MSYTPPQLIADRYRLVAPLGQGGMGRVWKARDEVLHRDVAIKELVPPPGLTPDERREMRERSLREARAIARLNHGNVVRVFDVLRTDGDPWIVMEYVPSRSLQDVLATDGPVTPKRAAEIGLGVLAALRAAHRSGVMHRDVKPGNVLLGDDGRVVLTDFGLATVPGDPNVTRTGLVLGSPAYIAPERARDGTAGPEADLWSLGATLYAAVEGQSPYARPSAIATLAALATEPPPQAKRAGPLKGVLNGLLRKDPASRIDAEVAERLLRRAAGRRDRSGLSLLDGVRRPSPLGGQRKPQAQQGGLPAPRSPQEQKPTSPPVPPVPTARVAETAKLGPTPLEPTAKVTTPPDSAAVTVPATTGSPVPGEAAGTASRAEFAQAEPGGAAVSKKPPTESESPAGAAASGTGADTDKPADLRKPADVGAPSAGVRNETGTREWADRNRGDRQRAERRPPTPQGVVSAAAVPPVAAPAPGAAVRRNGALAAAVRDRRVWLVGALVVVLLLALGVLLPKLGRDAASGPGSDASAAPTTATSADQTPTAPATEPTTTPPTTAAATTAPATPTPTPAGRGEPVVPDGWYLYRDATGFSLPLPNGMRMTGGDGAGHTFFADVDGRRKLIIGQTNTPQPDPEADWWRQEPGRKNFVQNYRLISIVKVDYWVSAADWEWTQTDERGAVRVRNRGFITAKGRKAYAIRWEVPAADWERELANFNILAEGFRPDHD